MNQILTPDIKILITYSIIPSASGGLVIFLWGLRKGHYKNNKYFNKLLIELLGAILTASFILSLFPSQDFKIFIAFAIGIAWANIIHAVRNRITKLVEAALGEIDIKE